MSRSRADEADVNTSSDSPILSFRPWRPSPPPRRAHSTVTPTDHYGRRRRAAPRSAPSRSFATHLLGGGGSGLEPGGEDPSAILRGLARYQDTADDLVAPQRRVSSVVLAPKRVQEPSRYTAPPAAFTVLRGSR